jgi:hypothetical protein
LAECVFTIALMQQTTGGNSHAVKEPKRVMAKDGGKLVDLAPNSVFMVAEHKDAGFGTKEPELLIFLDGEDAHGWDSLRSTLLLQSPILPKSDLLVGVEAMDTLFVLKEAFKPDLTVRVRVC